jgi:hypothetical protein
MTTTGHLDLGLILETMIITAANPKTLAAVIKSIL